MLFDKFQRGMSLVELMIAMALGLVIVGMLGSAFISSSVTNRALNEASLLTENGRFATQVLSDEIQMAGYFGSYDLPISTIAAIPDVCAVTLTGLINGMNIPVHGFNEVAAWSPACLPAGDELKAGTDVLVIRRSNTATVDVAALSATEYYVQSTSVNVRVDLGDDVANFDLSDKLGAPLTTVRKYAQTIFYVSGLDDQLKRLSLFENGYTMTPIADNVDAFELEYGIDRSGNGAPNTDGADANFVAAPASIAEWQDVVYVRGYILVRSATAQSQTLDTKIYTVGSVTVPKETVGPFNDNFRRRLFSFSTRANNLSMRREGTI